MTVNNDNRNKVLICVDAFRLQNKPKDDNFIPVLQIRKQASREVSCLQQAARKGMTGTWHPTHLPSSTHLLEVLLGDEATGISDVVLEGLRAHNVLEFQEHVEELEDHLHVG